jgi:hypothetical protein
LQHSGHKENDVRNITTSETQGYGMMMAAYMAGSEEALGLSEDEWRNGSESLKDYFDAMLRAVIAFPVISPGSTLFAWKLVGAETYGDDGKSYAGEGVNKTAHFIRIVNGNSATDGDMDIIYALLLADKQWGSDTKFNGRSYKDIALRMLADLWLYCIHKEHYTLQLGDWSHRATTRSSDFILSHLKSFAEADPEHDWQLVLDATLNVIREIRDAEDALGNENGLLPDFIVRDGDRWVVPEGRVLERTSDNAYSYNAVRNPWRLGTHYMLFGNTPIGGKSLHEYIIGPIDAFAQEYSGGSPENLSQLRMTGAPFGSTNPGLFAAPLLVAAAATGRDQDWVNAFYEGWMEYRNVGGSWQSLPSGMDTWRDNHYGDYINLLAMLAANGYWWAP